ncbi:hypothetical protein ABEB36_009452 [Hypothenemus hampei]
MARKMDKYEDIIENRRNDLINWNWSTRTLRTQVAVKIYPRPAPESHKLAVLHAPKIRELVDEISSKRNIKKEIIAKEVVEILEEIGYKKSLKVIRYLSYALTKIFLNISSGIFVNYQGISKIKSQMGNRPVIFVPSHRSYADFIIFSYVFFYYDIEIPAIAAGMDFHSMMGMGEMLRNTGAFFMRRTYNDDSLYWSIFKEYVYQLVCKGDLPIEFFIEGTRSRSNKSVTPKYGLINMILKAYFLSEVPDILFVPVSINYDRLLEENLFAFELLGIPKPKETTSAFFKSLSIIKQNYGNIFFHFGDPISTRDILEDKINRTKYSKGPTHIHEINEEEKRVIPILAYEIVRKQQSSTVISYFNLIALILNNHITRDQNTTSLHELCSEVRILRNVLRLWGAPIFERDIEETVLETLMVHKGLVTTDENQTIGLITNKITTGKLNADKLKAHALSENTISYSVPFITLQIYANPVLHYLVDGALVVIILRSVGEMAIDDLFKHFCFLRAIFSYEFVLLESWYKMQFESSLNNLLGQNIIICKNGQYNIYENKYFEEVLISSIQPFILSHYVITEMLLKTAAQVDEKTIFTNAQKLLEEAINEKKMFIHPYCMSLDSFGNCLGSLGKMKVIEKKQINGKNVFNINQQSIAKVKRDLEIYIPSFHVIKSFDIFLHIKSKL